MSSLKEFVEKAKAQGYKKEDILQDLLKKGYTKEEIERAFGKKSVVKTSSKELEITEKIKLLIAPKAFFSSVRENSIKNSLITYIISAVISGIISVSLTMILSSYRILSLGLFPIILLFISVIGTFVYSLIVHWVVKLMKGKGNFVDTYNACTYSLVPSVLLSVIPLIGFLAIIYSIILMTFGLSSYHNISKGKAVFAALIPLIISFVLVILLIIYLIFALRNVF